MIGNFGRTELPEEQKQALRRAIRLEYVTIGFLVVTVILVYLVLGSSQAMKAAWIEDLLSFAPPLAFLLAVRIVRRPPSVNHPYGYHRSIGIAHIVAGVALVVMGTYLLVDSAIKLVVAEHPTIGGVQLFGVTFWLGWLMIGALSLTIVPPVIIGRIKMRLAETLHDKVLYADADMNKADWMTAVGAIVGILGIGLGLWWLDAAAAIFIAQSILRDGIRNLRGAVRDVMDGRATTFDGERPHPVAGEIDVYLASLPWVAEVGSRMRDEGHVFHIESFVVPADDSLPALSDVEAATRHCRELDWKVQDIAIVFVSRLPDEVVPTSASTPR